MSPPLSLTSNSTLSPAARTITLFLELLFKFTELCSLKGCTAITELELRCNDGVAICSERPVKEAEPAVAQRRKAMSIVRCGGARVSLRSAKAAMESSMTTRMLAKRTAKLGERAGRTERSGRFTKGIPGLDWAWSPGPVQDTRYRQIRIWPQWRALVSKGRSSWRDITGLNLQIPTWPTICPMC